MYINELAITIKARFRIYTHIICDDNKTLWETEHCKKNRTKYLNKLTYNETRKAYRINSQWVSKKRLYRFMIPCNEILIIRKGQEHPF